MENKYRTGWRLLLAIYTLFAFTGHHWIPNDWRSLNDDIALADDWILSRASYPGLFAIGLGLIIGTWLLPEAIKIARKVYGLEPKPRPNMPLWRAMDYIVNDSRARLKRPPPPYVMQDGPHKGAMVTHKGVEHEDARQQISQEIIGGLLQVWGRKGTVNRFEGFVRPISTQFWQYSGLHPMFCQHETTEQPQTWVTDRDAKDLGLEEYSGLMVNRYQVEEIWPRQWLWVRLWRWISNRPRVSSSY
jgi:hypothetical protein